MIEASTTRKPVKPAHAQPFIDHGLLILAHAAGAHRMIGGRAATANEIEQVVIVVASLAWFDLFGDVARHRGRLKDTTHRCDTRHNRLAVLLRRQIIRIDCRGLSRIG